MRKPYLAIIAAMFIGALVLAACGPTYTRSDGTTQMVLLDVASGGAQTGKVASTRYTESYWQLQGTNVIVRCYYNYHWWTKVTTDPRDCDQFGIPDKYLPPDARMLALNLGIGQKTQSVWQVSKLGDMKICDHDRNFWVSTTGSFTECRSFDRPVQFAKDVTLATINSGRSILAQSFWNHPDGTVTVCSHDQTGGFLGFGDKSFGALQSCSNMPVPAALFPSGLTNIRLVGMTSDSSNAWETFWQADDDTVVQCKHDYDGSIFTGYYLGVAEWCNYWKAPSGDVMPAGR